MKARCFWVESPWRYDDDMSTSSKPPNSPLKIHLSISLILPFAWNLQYAYIYVCYVTLMKFPRSLSLSLSLWFSVRSRLVFIDFDSDDGKQPRRWIIHTDGKNGKSTINVFFYFFFSLYRLSFLSFMPESVNFVHLYTYLSIIID